MADGRAEGGAIVKTGKMAKQLRRARRKIKWLQRKLAEAQAPYECKQEDLLWVNARDLKRLVHLACQVNDDYEAPWFQRVITANSRYDRKLEMVLHGFMALHQLLDLPLPPRGIRQTLESQTGITKGIQLN